MTITCPACSHANDIVSEFPSKDWQSAACSACEANFVLVNPLASQGRPSSRRPLSQKFSWWRRIRLWALGGACFAADVLGSIQGGIFS